MLDSDSEEFVNTTQSQINRILIRPARLNLTLQNNMTTLQDIKNYVEMIPTYEGDITTLNNFIQTVDETYVILNTLQMVAAQKVFAFNLIKNRLINDAKKIVSQNKFTNWEDLKLYLSTNFSDRTTAETLLGELFESKYKQNSEITLKTMLDKFEIYKSKIFAKDYNLQQKNAIIIENQKAVVNKFISLLPPIIKGSFIVKQPSTLEQCDMLLKNEFSYANSLHNSPMTRNDTKQNTNTNKGSNFTFNPPPKQFPGQYFPSKPFNIHAQPTPGPNKFRRQNLVNSYETRKFQPQPMSTQTRNTQPMTTSTIKQNYNNEIQNDNTNIEEQNFEEYEIDNDNDNTDTFLEETPEIEQST